MHRAGLTLVFVVCTALFAMLDGEYWDACIAWDDNASYKTVGLPTCPDCHSTKCWLQYLRWERGAGITLNANQHHLVDEYDGEFDGGWDHA